ncbi:MAG: DUF4167 domain-containing protein [Aestuariivita sp.]|nr:DUF4167 domain-containing protein [Aestuariivita sp.]
MRSSKSRSRSKSNRNRLTGGNVVNRVFDSSGPEGKVRGTPQQIIEKYGQLARDAQLSNDRIAAENFLQHAEHYLRMLAEAQREIDSRREEQERQQRDRPKKRERNASGEHLQTVDVNSISGQDVNGKTTADKITDDLSTGASEVKKAGNRENRNKVAFDVNDSTGKEIPAN